MNYRSEEFNPISDEILLYKFRDFFIWTRLFDEKERSKMSAKLMEIGDKRETIFQLLKCLDEYEDVKKLTIWLGGSCKNE